MQIIIIFCHRFIPWCYDCWKTKKILCLDMDNIQNKHFVRFKTIHWHMIMQTITSKNVKKPRHYANGRPLLKSGQNMSNSVAHMAFCFLDRSKLVQGNGTVLVKYFVGQPYQVRNNGCRWQDALEHSLQWFLLKQNLKYQQLHLHHLRWKTETNQNQW